MGDEQRRTVDQPEDVDERYQVCGPETFHPDWLEVRADVNYVAGWRTARVSAAQLRVVLARANVPVEPDALWVNVRADGTGVVCLDPPTAVALAQLADEALREQQEGAPKIRGAPKDRAA